MGIIFLFQARDTTLLILQMNEYTTYLPDSMGEVEELEVVVGRDVEMDAEMIGAEITMTRTLSWIARIFPVLTEVTESYF